MRYEVEVIVSAGYIVSVESENDLEACEYAEEQVRRDLNGALWMNLESLPLPVPDEL